MNTNYIIITDADHLVHMNSIISVCPDAPKKKQNNTIKHMSSTLNVCPNAPKKDKENVSSNRVSTVARKLF